jgi:hypothetical protein
MEDKEKRLEQMAENDSCENGELAWRKLVVAEAEKQVE